MWGEVSVVSAHLFLEKVSAQCKRGHFTEMLIVCVRTVRPLISTVFFISVTHKNKLICLATLSSISRGLRGLKLLMLLLKTPLTYDLGFGEINPAVFSERRAAAGPSEWWLTR